MDFQIGKYMKVDKRLNYFRRNIEAGFMQSCSKSTSTILPALCTAWSYAKRADDDHSIYEGNC